MNYLSRLLAALVLATPAGASAAATPSFNCEQASTYAEQLICNSEILSQRDKTLGNLYLKVMAKLTPDAQQAMKAEQQAWLETRETDCNLYEPTGESCLIGLYEARNSALSQMLAFDSSVFTGDKELKILRMTPNGEDVPAARQLVFQFDRPVVSIGRMERDAAEIPVHISPALACEWRWLNTSALSCNLRAEHSMQLATAYRVQMKPGITAENGAVLKKTAEFNFTTLRPRATYTRFINWLSPGTPLLQVSFNQPVSKRSVEAVFSMSPSQSQGGTGVIAYPDNMPRTLPWWVMQETNAQVDDQWKAIDDDEFRRVWILEPKQELPLDSNISVKIEPGLQSSEGEEPGNEKRVVVSFDTFPEFKFLGIQCTPYGERYSVKLPIADIRALGSDKRCAPLSSVAMVFSSPVLMSTMKKALHLTPALDGGRKDYDPWENARDWSRLSSPHQAGREYALWLPERLQAFKKYQVRFDQRNFRDEFSRSLVNGENFEFFTSHREPSLVVNHSDAVLEQGIDSDVPLYVTNLTNVDIHYDSFGEGKSSAGQHKALTVPQVEDVAMAVPLGARDLVREESGVVLARLKPNPMPPDWHSDTQIFAQVTPFQVHLKLGHFSSLAWVTRFDNGEPVKNAKVSILTGLSRDILALQETHYSQITDKSGMAELPGLEVIDPNRERIFDGYNRPGLFTKVEHDGDIALLPVNGNYRITGDVYPHMQRSGGHTHAWGTTAQGVYKLGDEIQFKLYVREQSNEHWVQPKSEQRYQLHVYDPQNKTVYQKADIPLSEYGAFDANFKVPEQGAVGWYRFELSPVTTPENSYSFVWTPMSVMVSDFTPSPFSVTTELNGQLFTPGQPVSASTHANYYAGGPYADAELRLTAKLTPKAFYSQNPQAKNFTFGSFNGKLLTQQQQNIVDLRALLNKEGQHQLSFKIPDADIYFGSVFVESAVRDDRGKFVASSARAEYAGRDRFVGIKNTRWLYEKGKPASVQVVVVNQLDALVADVAITINIQRREIKAARVKGPGNAYLTQNVMSWVEESSCHIVSAASASSCEFTPQHPGSYQFIASIKDSQDRVHTSEQSAWVTGQGNVVWDQSEDASLQIIPETEQLNVGDTARYLIKNPYPGAKALVSVERYGVLDSWVETLDTSTPVIEVPIKANYLPGFYLSVLVVSPRVAQPLGPMNVDLGKPSYRMGYVTARVSDPYKKIALVVASDKKVYKPREKVTLKIHVDRKKIRREKVELAVVAVDESVLALNGQGESYYDPYAGFNRLDTLDVLNYSLISRLLGRQKFEKKGANPGGDGARTAQLRSTFKFVSYWNPSVIPDKRGRAEIEFEVPDNLTGWRVLVLAVTPDDFMGLGSHTIQVNRPTELRPVMPNQLVEGDHFDAGFSVMNRTGEARTLNVVIEAKGPLDERAATSTSTTQQLQLAAFSRETIWLPLRTKGSGELQFTVKAGDKIDADAMQHSVPVKKRRALEVAATYGTTTATTVSENVRIPEGIYTDVGWLGAVISPSVIGNVDGAINYMKNYPHLCWEQRLSRAVFANASLALEEYLHEDTRWIDAERDVVHALEAAANFQAPSGGMAYWVPNNLYVSPYLSAYTAMAFHWLRRSGYTIPSTVEENLQQYLLTLLRRDDFPSFYTKGMASSVRAVALAALSASGKLTAEDIYRYRAHVPQMDLFGKAHFLTAAVNVLEADDSLIEQTLTTLLSHAGQSGGKFQFSEAWDDSYRYILATPLRSNCAILSSVLQAQSTDFSALVADVPFKMVRSITQSRGNRDHWENTQENVFCLNALMDYAKIYEHEDPSMQVHVAVGENVIGEQKFSKRSDTPVSLRRAITAADEGEATQITLQKEGAGRLYYSAQIAYDLKEDNATRINSGIEVRREYSVEREGKFVLLNSPMQIQRGDIVKVDIFVSLATARHFVVVSDPIPGGLEPVNTQLATASTVDAAKSQHNFAEQSWFFKLSDWTYYGRYFWSFYHRELRHDGAYFYADYLPAGDYHLGYTAQAIASGEFSVMATQAEEMYDPDVYGRGLPARLEVEN